jgi:lipopolysaccharide export system protein LptC
MQDGHQIHSQLVGWGKIILPLCALALLSTLFLFARGTSEITDIDLSEVAEIAREQRVSAPAFSGVTDDGAVIFVNATSAKPDTMRPDTVTAQDMRLRMDNADGSFLEVNAVSGEVDGRAEIAQFLGLARIETSNGYALETNGLLAELATGTITSDGLLEIHAPFGELTAGKVTFQTARADEGQQMLFTNGVRLLYKPQIP